MIVIQFREDLFHDGFAEEDGLGADPELFTIAVNGSHLTVIQVYDLAMFPHQSRFLFLQIFRIDS